MELENGQIGYKLSLENRITKLETSVEEIRINHLPHLEAKVDRITWLALTSLATMVVNMALIILKLKGS